MEAAVGRPTARQPWAPRLLPLTFLQSLQSLRTHLRLWLKARSSAQRTAAERGSAMLGLASLETRWTERSSGRRASSWAA